MAGRAPGAPSIAQTQQFRALAEGGETTSTKRLMWNIPYNDPKATNEFPIVPTPSDPYDTIANIKDQFGKEAVGGAQNATWTIPFTDSDAAYMMRKRDYEEQAEFDAWVMQEFDTTDPAQLKMLREIAPDLFQRREELIDLVQGVVSRVAKIRNRGLQDRDDLVLMWAIQTGRIELPEGRVWDPKDWRKQRSGAAANATVAQITAADEEKNRSTYEFGLFAPLQWLTYPRGGTTPTPGNRADPIGSQTTYEGAGVKYPAWFWANRWGRPVPYPNVYNTAPVAASPAGIQATTNTAGQQASVEAMYARTHRQPVAGAAGQDANGGRGAIPGRYGVA